jgi:hypothetical protein
VLFARSQVQSRSEKRRCRRAPKQSFGGMFLDRNQE